MTMKNLLPNLIDKNSYNNAKLSVFHTLNIFFAFFTYRTQKNHSFSSLSNIVFSILLSKNCSIPIFIADEIYSFAIFHFSLFQFVKPQPPRCREEQNQRSTNTWKKKKKTRYNIPQVIDRERSRERFHKLFLRSSHFLLSQYPFSLDCITSRVACMLRLPTCIPLLRFPIFSTAPISWVMGIYSHTFSMPASILLLSRPPLSLSLSLSLSLCLSFSSSCRFDSTDCTFTRFSPSYLCIDIAHRIVYDPVRLCSIEYAQDIGMSTYYLTTKYIL